MMRRFLGALALMTITAFVFAQDGSAKMVKWDFSSKKIDDKTYEVRFSATIDGNFHIYAQKLDVDGPVPTSFVFTKNPLIVFNGKPKEVGKVIKKHEEVWGGNVSFYENKVDFVQTVQLKSKVKTNVGGTVEFMVCDDKKCLPPAEVSFKVPVGG